MNTNTVYIVDDDVSILESIKHILSTEGYRIITADNIETFFSLLKKDNPGVVILDIFFGEEQITGDVVLKKLSESYPNTQCIVISGESNIQKTLNCIRNGALDFIEKPVSLPRLITAVRNAMNIYNTKSLAQNRNRILGISKGIKDVYKKVKKLSSINESVLICGENGTGKELISENLHMLSKRYTMPMYKVNCTSLNQNLIESELFGHTAGSFTGAKIDKKGFFEIADKSTLFIDEIGDFLPGLQSKILRVLQEKTVIPVGSTEERAIDVRLIFATNRDLPKMIQQASFREDMYFRISTFTIVLPPLRERLEDIDILAPHFLNTFLIENKLNNKEFSRDSLEKLKEYSYPGNIRELAKIVKNAAFFCEHDIIGPRDIDFNPDENKCDIWFKTKNMSLVNSKAFFEKEFIKNRLKYFNYNILETSKSLGILKNNLYRKLKYYEIKLPDRG